jgi:hypothetical protein
VARNTKDEIFVSFYRHHKLMKMQGFSDENLENFADLFMKDCSEYPALYIFANNNSDIIFNSLQLSCNHLIY